MAVPPVFVSGQVLTAAQMNAIGIWEVKAQTIGTAVSAVTVTDAFTADYDNYLVMVSGGVASTTNQLRLTLGSTTANYYYAGGGGSFAGASSLVSGSNVAFHLFGNGSTNALSGWSYIIQPNIAKRTQFMGQFMSVDTVGAGWSPVGFLNDANQYTAFTITTSTGTMTGGEIRVYGLRN